MSFFSVVVAHVPDLIHLCLGWAPQEMPAGGKVGLKAFSGEKKKINKKKGVERNLLQQQDSVGTVGKDRTSDRTPHIPPILKRLTANAAGLNRDQHSIC